MSMPPLPPPPPPEPDDGTPGTPATPPPDPYQPAPDPYQPHTWATWSDEPGAPGVPGAPGQGHPTAPGYPQAASIDTGPSRLTGVGVGCGGLLLTVVALVVIGNQNWLGPSAGLVALLPLGLLIAGIVFTAQERTRRFGTGLLISVGVAVLIAGGSCLALLAAFSTA